MIVDLGNGFRLTIRVRANLVRYLEGEDYRCAFEDAVLRELQRDLRALRSRLNGKVLLEFYRPKTTKPGR